MLGDIDPRAGKLLDPTSLLDVSKLLRAYYAGRPDTAEPAQRVTFGTSGHRGSAFNNAFNEGHILAIAQAICIDRETRGVDGPSRTSGGVVLVGSRCMFADTIWDSIGAKIGQHHGSPKDALPRSHALRGNAVFDAPRRHFRSSLGTPSAAAAVWPPAGSRSRHERRHRP